MSPGGVLVVIQARAGSTRLPGKVLADLAVADKAAFAQLASQAKAKLGA